MSSMTQLLLGALTIAVGLLMYDRIFKGLGNSVKPVTTAEKPPQTVEQMLAAEGF